jgi:ribosomal 30S subunit maturation factor RimM
VGTVTAVHLGAGPPLLSVAARDGEVLVPLAEEICRDIDVRRQVIVITPPEGLIEANARR